MLDGWRKCSAGGGSARRVEGVLGSTAVEESQNLALGVTARNFGGIMAPTRRYSMKLAIRQGDGEG